MSTDIFSRIAGRRGFTLVELIVSMAILSIMLLAMASVTDYVARLWLNGIGAVDNFTKARVVLNLLDRDIQMMVLRRDMAAFMDTSTPASPACTFYTNVQGNPGAGLTAPDARALSLVQYVLSNPSTLPTLTRINYGMNFLGTSGATPTLGSTTTLPIPGNAKLQTETVFTGIIRFQWQFVDGTGAFKNPPYSFSSTPPTTSSPPATPVPFWFDFAVPSASYNPHSVVISMLVLSNPAYKLATLSGSTTMTTLLNDFPNTLPPGNLTQTYSQYWNSILNPSIGNLDTSLPPVVRSGIQVFERHIPLPTSTPSP